MTSDSKRPYHFDELPLHRKVKVFLRDRYRALNLPNRILLWLLLIGVVGASALFAAKPLIKKWRQNNALIAARQFVKNGDVVSAAASYSTAVSKSTDVERWREYAQFATDIRHPAAPKIWDEVIRLSPNDADAWGSKVQACLLLLDFRNARRVLDEAPFEVKQSLSFKLARASALVMMDEREEARRLFADLELPSTSTPKIQLVYSLLALDLGTHEQKLQAPETLQQLAQSSDPQIQLMALQALIKHATENKLRAHGIEAAKRMLALPDVKPENQLLALEALIQFEAPNLDQTVAAVGKGFEESDEARQFFVQFLVNRDAQALARRWIDRLQTGAPDIDTARLHAEVMLARGDWDDFLENIQTSNLSGDTAYQIRQLTQLARGNAHNESTLRSWKIILQSNTTTPEVLGFALEIAKRSGWKEAALATLERGREMVPNNQFVLSQLASHYLEARDIEKLYDVQSHSAKLNPRNFDARNAALLVQLILGAGNPAENLAAAEALIADSPNTPEFRTTYALALYRAGRLVDAEEIFASMSEDEMRNPERALYHGMVLADLGQKTLALKRLQFAGEHLDKLFDEHTQLHRQATRTAEALQDDTPSAAK